MPLTRSSRSLAKPRRRRTRRVALGSPSPHPSSQTRPPPLYIFSAVIPLHPNDARHRWTVDVTYSNLKPSPSHLRLLSPLRECAFRLPLHRHPASRPRAFRVFYFVHVPKTGGAALKLSLAAVADRMNSLRQPPQNLLLPGKTRGSYVRVLSRGHLGARAVDPRLPTFALLREPLARIRSAFRFVLGGGKGSAVWGDDNRVIQELRDVFAAQRIRTISDIFEAPLAVRRRILGHTHFQPMTDFVCDAAGRLLIDRVFRMEALGDDATELSKHLGVRPFPLVHTNRSHVAYTLTPRDREHLERHYAGDIALYHGCK